MTRIKIKSAPGIYNIKISGHAEKVNDGEGNLLCAAVSTLSQTLLQCMIDLKSKGEVEMSYEMGDGYLNIHLRYKSERVRGYLEAIETGFLLLQNSYEKNIFVVSETTFTH